MAGADEAEYTILCIMEGKQESASGGDPDGEETVVVDGMVLVGVSVFIAQKDARGFLKADAVLQQIRLLLAWGGLEAEARWRHCGILANAAGGWGRMMHSATGLETSCHSSESPAALLRKWQPGVNGR